MVKIKIPINSCKNENIDTLFRYIYEKKNLSNIYLQEYRYDFSYNNNNSRYLRRTDEKDIDDDQKFIYYCDYGIYEIDYKNSKIIIDYQKKSDPIALSDRIVFYEELYIICNDYEDEVKNIKIIEEFITEITDEKLKPLKNNIKIYISCDSYWAYLSKIPKRAHETIFLDEKKDILDDLELFMKDEKDYKKFGIPYKRNYLFHGPPGTGKTSLITSIASKYELNIYKLSITKNMDDTDFAHTISKINNGILVLEDVDSLFTERNNTNKNYITFSGILNILDGVTRKNKQITIMTTNHIDKLDEAFKRPGRVDKIIKFDYSNKQQIIDMCNCYLSNLDKDIIKKFIEVIKKIKTTSAILQKFLFENRNNKNIIDNIDDYNVLTKQYNNSNNMYM
tara:strand:- start:313 stop:1491 length:1179 start_codon:yes stop_codon:yes gene_type:complete